MPAEAAESVDTSPEPGWTPLPSTESYERTTPTVRLARSAHGDRCSMAPQVASRLPGFRGVHGSTSTLQTGLHRDNSRQLSGPPLTYLDRAQRESARVMRRRCGSTSRRPPLSAALMSARPPAAPTAGG